MAAGSSHIKLALDNLTKTVQTNLKHEKDWTDVTPYRSPESKTDRPLLYGLPPRRMYVHPDEQIEILKAEKDLGQRIPQPPELEWVLPIHLAEKWTVAQFADVFDSIGAIPPGTQVMDDGGDAEEHDGDDNDAATAAATATCATRWKQWRGPKRGKRLILAIVQDDSTISYYFMHDGIVKPRQN